MSYSRGVKILAWYLNQLSYEAHALLSIGLVEHTRSHKVVPIHGDKLGTGERVAKPVEACSAKPEMIAEEVWKQTHREATAYIPVFAMQILEIHRSSGPA